MMAMGSADWHPVLKQAPPFVPKPKRRLVGLAFCRFILHGRRRNPGPGLHRKLRGKYRLVFLYSGILQGYGWSDIQKRWWE